MSSSAPQRGDLPAADDARSSLRQPGRACNAGSSERVALRRAAPTFILRSSSKLDTVRLTLLESAKSVLWRSATFPAACLSCMRRGLAERWGEGKRSTAHAQRLVLQRLAAAGREALASYLLQLVLAHAPGEDELDAVGPVVRAAAGGMSREPASISR